MKWLNKILTHIFFIYIVGTPKKNNLIQTIPVYFNEFEVSLDVKLTDYIHSLTSILHITKGGNNGDIGDRLPAIFLNNRYLYISTPLNSTYRSYPNTFIYPNRFHNINIQQKKISENLFQYTIKIRDYTIHRSINKTPLTLYNAKVYLGDPWYPAAKVLVKNLVIKSEPTGVVILII